MEYLQYDDDGYDCSYNILCFKPCYKWNTFNTKEVTEYVTDIIQVLNLVINGIPSILKAELANSIRQALF